MSDTGDPDLERLLDPDLPHTFRGLDPDAVQGLLTDAVESLRAAQRREEELRSTVAALEEELRTARADATTELDQARRRGRQMVNEAQLVRRRILEDLIRRRKVLRRQIEQLRVGRERLLEAYEVVGQTVEEATAELGVALVSATAAAERAGRRLLPDEVTDEDLHAMDAEIEAARAAGLPILDPLTPAERRADQAAAVADPEVPVAEGDEEVVAPLVEVEPVVAAFEEMRVLGPVQPDETTEAAGPADPGGPADPTGAADPEEPADPTGPADPEEPADPTGPADPGDGVDPSTPGDPPGRDGGSGAATVAPEGDEGDDALVLPLFDRLRAGPEPTADLAVPGPGAQGDATDAEVAADADEARGTAEAAEPEQPALPDLLEAEPEAATEVDPVAVLADDLARRLRRVLADEQNQVLDRLRQDRRGQLGVDALLEGADARIARLATAIEPQLREVTDDPGPLAARLAAEVVDGVHAEVTATVGAAAGDVTDLAAPLREAFRAWRSDRILPLAATVAAEALGR